MLREAPSTSGNPLTEWPRSQNGSTIVVLERIRFVAGSSRIYGDKSQKILDSVASVLKKTLSVKKVRIESHTDAHGSVDVERKLTQARADAVKAYLVGKGVDEARLEAKGYGPDKPIAPNSTEEGRAKNRRLEFVIIDIP